MIFYYTIEDAQELLDLSKRSIQDYCKKLDCEKKLIDGKWQYVLYDPDIEKINKLRRPW